MHLKCKYLIKINNLIKNYDFIKPFMIGHSTDDSKDIVNAFINAGADVFEKKPTDLKRFTEIIKKETKKVLFLWI